MEKQKELNVNIAGLMLTEEDTRVNGINRSAKDINIKMPADFAQLEEMNYGHNFECFHHLDIDGINAEAKGIHHSAHLFYKRPEVKNKVHVLIHNYVVLNDT